MSEWEKIGSVPAAAPDKNGNSLVGDLRPFERAGIEAPSGGMIGVEAVGDVLTLWHRATA